jgi:hypothetical protein
MVLIFYTRVVGNRLKWAIGNPQKLLLYAKDLLELLELFSSPYGFVGLIQYRYRYL